MLLHISIVYSFLVLHESPLYKFTMVCLSSPFPWTLELLSILATTNPVAVNTNEQALVWAYAFTFLG